MMQGRRFSAWLRVGRRKQREVLRVAAVAIGNPEEHITVFTPDHIKPDHVFVKLLHGVQIPDHKRHLAQSFDTAIRRTHGFSFSEASQYRTNTPNPSEPSLNLRRGIGAKPIAS